MTARCASRDRLHARRGCRITVSLLIFTRGRLGDYRPHLGGRARGNISRGRDPARSHENRRPNDGKGTPTQPKGPGKATTAQPPRRLSGHLSRCPAHRGRPYPISFLCIRSEEGAVTDDIDPSGNAVRQVVDPPHRRRREQGVTSAGHSDSVPDISACFRPTQGQEMVTRRYSLSQLAQFSSLQ